MPPDETVEGQQEAPDESIRSQLLSAFDAQEETAAEAPVNGRARDERGRFAATTDAAADDEPPEKPDTLDVQPTAAAEPSKPTVEAPQHWSAADKDTFAKVPAEHQEWLLNRHKAMEADYTRKTQDIAEFQKTWTPVRDMFAPFDAQIRAAGYTPATLIQAWADVERKLTSGQGVEVVRDLARNYRLDPAQIMQALGVQSHQAQQPAAEGQQPQPHIPPELAARLEAAERSGSQITQYLAAQERQRLAEAANRVHSAITEFQTARDASGNLLHPHFEAVQDEMAILAQAARVRGEEPKLDDLYSKAVWANTSTRDRMLADQRAAEEAQRAAAEKKAREEARAKAERARRAGSSVTGSPGPSQSAIAAAKANGASLRDTLSAAYEEVTASA